MIVGPALVSHLDAARDARSHNALDVLVEWVKPKSKVLWISSVGVAEPARLTDDLGCTVETVRLPLSESADTSRSSVVWQESLADVTGKRFDSVVLLEVLEYLPDPAALLSSVECLLEDDGCLLTAVPNVATNDHVVRLFVGSGAFLKAPQGQRVPLSLFGPRDLHPLFVHAGLSIVGLVPLTTGLYEVTVASPSLMVDEAFAQMLASNPWGGVSSFVIKAKKRSCVTGKDVVSLGEPPSREVTMSANLYWAEEGESFSYGKRMPIAFRMGSRLDAELDLSERNAAQVRIDPVEGAWCIVDSLSVVADGTYLEPKSFNGTPFSEGFIFRTIDPMLVYEVPQGIKTVHISARVTLALGAEGERLIHALVDEVGRKVPLERKLAERECELTKLKCELTKLRNSQVKAISKRDVRIQELKDRLATNKRNTSSISWMIRHLGGLILRRLHLKKDKH